MKKLFEIIDYKNDCFTKHYKRDAVRAVIFNNNKLALVFFNKEKYYKFPGGGIKSGESHKKALYREVLEECGKKIILSSITPLGYVKEKYMSQVVDNELFESCSYYYFGICEDETYPQNLDEYEKSKGLVFSFCEINKAIDFNYKYWKSTGNKMILRELKVMILLKELLNNKMLPLQKK